jgi:hypothetical protein
MNFLKNGINLKNEKNKRKDKKEEKIKGDGRKNQSIWYNSCSRKK